MSENKMGTMPVGRLIGSMAAPAIISMLIQAMYNIVDSLFVAQIGEQALAAVTFINPIQLLMISVAVGTGVGVNSLISRRLGARMFDEANNAASIGFKLSFFGWAAFALFGLFLSQIFMDIFTNNPYILKNGTTYLRIITIGCLFVMISVTCEKILQATGNMIFPMITNITGAVINIALDPILIFGLLGAPKMGVAGAAIATIIGQACGMTMALIFLFKKDHAVVVDIKTRFNRNTVKDIYSVGAPAIVMQSIGSVMLFGLNGILATFSETAVAVLGVYGRLQSFAFMPCFGINQGSLPVMGYNYGARDKHRLMKAYKTAFFMALVIMVAGFALFQLAPRLLLSMFNATDAMYNIGIPAFRALSICFIPAAFGIISSGFFQATNHGLISLFGSLIRQLVAILPLAWFLGRTLGVSAVWWAFPLSEIIGTIYMGLMVHRVYVKDVKNFEGLNKDEEDDKQ